MKVALLEVDTFMANKELREWLIKAIERQNDADPAKRKAVLNQKPHVQEVKGKKERQAK